MTTPKARALTYGALVQLKAALDEAATPEDFLAEADAISPAEGTCSTCRSTSGQPDP